MHKEKIMVDWNYKGNVALVTLANGQEIWACGSEEEIREKFQMQTEIPIVKIDYNAKS